MTKVLIGLDIGIQTIKAVQLSREKTRTTLLAAGYIPTPARTPNATETMEEQTIANSVNRLVRDMKVSTAEVSASLFSSKVVTRVIEVPVMKESELAASIQWEAEQYIPWPLSKVKLDYAIIAEDTPRQKMKVLLVAAPLVLIERYMRIITAAGLTPVALETEILAVSRSIAEAFVTISNLLIVSIGAGTTDIALLHNHTLVYTKSYPIGGITLTRAISDELGFEIAQAEEYKKTYGLEEDKLEGKIAKIISPFFTNITQEMEKTVTYFKGQYPGEEISTSVLTGGTARLPGLVLFITRNLGIDSQSSNPFLNLVVDPNVLSAVTPDASLYTAAVGLALKEI